MSWTFAGVGVFLVLLSCFCMSYCQDVKDVNSVKEMMKKKEKCEQQKQQLIKKIAKADKISKDEAEQSETFQNSFSAECKELEAFSYKSLTANEILQLVSASEEDPKAIYNIAQDIELGVLKQVMYNASGMGWGLPGSPLAPVLHSIGTVCIRRLGGIRSVTADQIRFFGPALTYSIPTDDIPYVHKSVVDFMLESIAQETLKADQYHEQHRDPYSEEQEDLNLYEKYHQTDMLNVTTYVRPPYDYAATINSLINDIGRMKALCRKTFREYPFKSLDEDVMNKTWVLMWCAPVKHCKALSIDLVQNYIGVLSKHLPWYCEATTENVDEIGKVIIKEFPMMTVCGRYFADKVMKKGPNRLVLDSTESLMRYAQQIVRTNKMVELATVSLRSLALCLKDKYLKQGIELVGCELATEGAVNGVFSKKLEAFVAEKCLVLPKDLSTLDCQDIGENYEGMLPYIDNKFWKKLPTNTLCSPICIEIFKGEDLSNSVRSRIMNRCFKEKKQDLSSKEVRDMGEMVTELPLETLDKVEAGDLVPAIGKIKTQMKKNRRKRRKNPRQKSVARAIAKKLAKTGGLGNITDSEEIMKTVSLTDLKGSVTDVEADLGLNDPSKEIHLTDAQNKWAMKKIMEKKSASNFSAEDIRSKKSLAKGFLSEDIEAMAQAQNDTAIEKAKALCEQTNWPLKPLEAINRELIVTGLIARNPDDPMKALTYIDVEAIGCECFMHFKYRELLDMETSVCSAVCQKIGYCHNLRCLNTVQRKNLLQACLQCKGLGTNLLTESDVDELGPNLISQLSATQILTLIPGSVLVEQMGVFKEMCMSKDFRIAVSSSLLQELGDDIDMDTLALMGSGVMMFPKAVLQGINASYIESIAETLVEEVQPSDEVALMLLKCCERWQTEEDIEYYKELKQNLLIAIKDAIIYKMQNPSRKKREIVNDWSCLNMQLVSEAFTTVSDAEIQAMNDTEFIDCLADIGSLSTWSAHQKSLLLSKTEEAFGTLVCNITVTDILNLGVIAEALTSEQISCMPLEDDDVISGFGSLSAWTTDQLTAMTARYMDARNLTDITLFTSSDISVMGHLLCGFTPSRLSDIPAAAVAGSGTQLGTLSECPIAQLVQIKAKATDPSAYGPVSGWTAAEVGELNFIIAGFTGAEIRALSVGAIESLNEEVIPKIPANVLKDMTTTQLEAFTDVQAVAVTTDQRAAMTAAQTALLDAAVSGEQEQEPEVTASPPPPPPSMGTLPSIESALLILGLTMFMLLLST